MAMNGKSGTLSVVGLGPGAAAYLTPDAQRALQEADAVFGYEPYLNRVPLRAGQRRYPSDNRQEIERAQHALTEAAVGARVAVVSGGDPGVFGMAAAVCEAIDHGPASWRDLRIEVIPGITAMLAVSARVGAPLGHDFCAISLSDNLKPWPVVERRLEAAATGGFVIGLYNPVSRARPWQLDRALEVLSRHLSPQTPAILGRGIGRATESIGVVTLGTIDTSQTDMSTCIIVGSAQTRVVARETGALVYTPRSMPAAQA